jgi:hypothetical protein
MSRTIAPDAPKQSVENGKITALRFSTQMVDVIFNAASLKAEEFAQAMVDNNSLVPTMNYSQLEKFYQYDPAYGWQYSDPQKGFRLTISENKTIKIEKIATSSELTF